MKHPRGIPSPRISCRLAISRISFSIFFLFAFAVLAGCSSGELSKRQSRAVTREIVAAIQKAAGRNAAITIRPEAASSWFDFFGAPSADDISAAVGSAAQADTLRAPLSQIAHRHKLTVAESSSSSALRFDFSAGGTRSHTIALAFPVVAHSSPNARGSQEAPRLAIIIDDMGNDRVADESILSLPFPLTISVLPHLSLSNAIADEAWRHGDTVMLHLPMQSESESTTPGEPIELRVGMPRSQVESTLAGMLATVPHAAGVNNHEGSRATANTPLMDALMPSLRDRGLFFVDSRTTASTVAFDSAERAGVRAASRKVFLDDSLSSSAIRTQIELAGRDAVQNGEAIAIGHPHSETIAALREALPRLKRAGIQLVPASDVVH